MMQSDGRFFRTRVRHQAGKVFQWCKLQSFKHGMLHLAGSFKDACTMATGSHRCCRQLKAF